MGLFNQLKILVLEKYQRLKIKNKVQKKVESRIFEEELVKLKKETKANKHEETREHVKIAAKIASKGVPKNIALGLASGASELKKGGDKIKEVKKEIQKHQRVTPTKKQLGKPGSQLSDLFITKTNRSKSKKEKEVYAWSLD